MTSFMEFMISQKGQELIKGKMQMGESGDRIRGQSPEKNKQTGTKLRLKTTKEKVSEKSISHSDLSGKTEKKKRTYILLHNGFREEN